ncbi:MAG TPA: ankyrin repeat domain-containing protein [Oligoflexia bacterium]|nr:ankyrin repeat domain-containing protein [Oligoflexia bacterium]HMP48309.1 ankyrin repeat domain-containing protein [Oligoflexia bacterium]
MNKSEAVQALKGIIATHHILHCFGIYLNTNDEAELQKALNELLVECIREDRSLWSLFCLAGARPDWVDYDRRNMAHHFASTNNVSCLQFVLEKGLDIHARDKWEIAPAHLAAAGGQPGSLKFLLDNGFDIHAEDCKKRTIVHLAAWMGHLNCLKIAIEYGANVDSLDYEGKTPYDLAVKRRSAAANKVAFWELLTK